MTEARMNITQRIAKARRAIEGYVQKDTTVKGSGGTYPAVTHDAVTAHIRAALIDAGVLTSYDVMSHHREQITYGRQGTTAFFTTLAINVSFVSVDDEKDRHVIASMGSALDSADKGIGKAISYAVKYAELKLMNLATGEDEESRFGALSPAERTIDAEQLDQIFQLLSDTNSPVERITTHFEKKHKRPLERLSDLTVADWNVYIGILKAEKEKKGAAPEK